VSNSSLESALPALYRHRFTEPFLERRNAVWKILCRAWFRRYIPPDARVLEIGAGYCEFINNVEAVKRVAVDVNPETRTHAGRNVQVLEMTAERLTDCIQPGSFDVVFMSNFLEHCRSRDQMLAVLRNAATVLSEDGRVLILGPNFRCCYRHYFDFFDHYLPLTEKAIVEAIQLAGFTAEAVHARTLPFTFAGRLPSRPWLVRLYLKLPWVWPLFGAQFFVVGRKKSVAAVPELLRLRAA
jgi:SAM-dependent methyltransferase